MKAQHTETPWSLNEWPQGDSEIRIGAKGTPRIATIHLRDVSINEQEANARFIVKAVNSHAEMLEALKDVIKAYQEMFDVMPVAFQTYIHIVEQAIAKAEAVEVSQ